MLTPEDYELIYRAVRDGTYHGSIIGAFVFHVVLVVVIFVLYVYFSRKYGKTIKSYSEIISAFLGIKKE